MDSWTSRSLSVLVITVVSSIGLTAAESPGTAVYSYPLKQTPAEIRVQGSSTLGHWDCTQDTIDGLARINISAIDLREKIADLLQEYSTGHPQGKKWESLKSEVRVAIDAKGFNCDNRRMEKDLAEAIRAEEYPSINYWFTKVESVSVFMDDEKGPCLRLKVRGDLLFGGKRRETLHTSQLWLSGDSLIEVSGSLKLEMTDFGINPPSAFFGLIKAEDHFEVGYHIKLKTKEMVSQESASTTLYRSFAKSQ